mmetsp:Transcript_5209/g.10774  ORF Transcript_5209/g.10774 Transcript_5209/m.10774 type:complete len:81 (-) Transcript_5209:616-858(-)|eukprot:CAMPEP_0197284394 /NCGR_PEP_ID=MMETSP1432-20130617/25421_1 /TAXON_ID=44447 /ORGANISM="Pseudo-nitzschia delicatissima, Strain UNC1205" /LENGTH=80 /DNA_ID=CAMNT_0042751403 /DNA_START=176 /DNA_END=418 /DNA_ORIENTATION=+
MKAGLNDGLLAVFLIKKSLSKSVPEVKIDFANKMYTSQLRTFENSQHGYPSKSSFLLKDILLPSQKLKQRKSFPKRGLKD